RDRRLYLWYGRSGRIIGKLEGHVDAVTALAFNRSGRLLASGSADREILIWSQPRSSDLAGIDRDHREDPEPEVAHRVKLFGRPNLLLNPAADQKHHFWKRRGLAYVLEQTRGNRCFGIRAGGSFWQDVKLQDAAGKRLLIIGRLSAEKITPDTRHGLPYLFGTFHGGPQGEKQANLIDAKHMFCTAKRPKQWTVAWGAFEIPEGVDRVRVYLNQAVVQGEARYGAYFDDVGVYLFETDQQAADFFDRYRKRDWVGASDSKE
ncbi:MAG: WD40 repeat domain-containing protein, partial [Phycisphaeraceae bacterium]|nr:WD40 repeat domain-containing protein [Phycisphaeraceae bacterium]